MILKCGRVRGRIVPSQQDWKLKQDRWGIEAKQNIVGVDT